MTFKRPFLFECKSLKGNKLYDRVCDFFLSTNCHNLKKF